MSKEKDTPTTDLPTPDCKHECGYNEIKNGECECYNREMDKYEEQAPC